MQRADEPLRKITLNLYEEDVDYLRRRYGWGWSEHVRSWIRSRIEQLRRPDDYEHD